MSVTASIGASASTEYHAPCGICGFTLWTPLARLRVSTAGLYDDSRFPGRSLLVLDEHYTDLIDVPPQVMNDYLKDLRDLRVAIGEATAAPRVNYAMLGNTEPHVHWHVIPRQPSEEPLPEKSPWQDPRPVRTLTRSQRQRLVIDLQRSLRESQRTFPAS